MEEVTLESMTTCSPFIPRVVFGAIDINLATRIALEGSKLDLVAQLASWPSISRLRAPFDDALVFLVPGTFPHHTHRRLQRFRRSNRPQRFPTPSVQGHKLLIEYPVISHCSSAILRGSKFLRTTRLRT